MTEQTLTAAELEGERELTRLIESGELATASPRLNESLSDEEETPAGDAKPEEAKPEEPANPAEAEPAKPAEPAVDPELAAQPDTADIDAQLAAEQQALLKLTEQRLAMEEAQKGLAAKYSEINPALDELADLLDAGELTQGAYDKQKRALEQQRVELERQYNANQAKLSELTESEHANSNRISTLEASKDPLTITVNHFLAQPVNAIYQDDAAAKALGSLFQTLKTMPKMAGKTDAELLALADRQYRALNDIEQPAKPQEKQPASKGETTEQRAERLARTVPTGVSGMPAVVTNATTDAYADLAAKSGPELEKILGSMSGDQLEEFLSKMK